MLPPATSDPATNIMHYIILICTFIHIYTFLLVYGPVCRKKHNILLASDSQVSVVMEVKSQINIMQILPFPPLPQ